MQRGNFFPARRRTAKGADCLAYSASQLIEASLSCLLTPALPRYMARPIPASACVMPSAAITSVTVSCSLAVARTLSEICIPFGAKNLTTLSRSMSVSTYASTPISSARSKNRNNSSNWSPCFASNATGSACNSS